MADFEVLAASALCLLSIKNYIDVLKRINLQKRKRRTRRLWMTSIHRNRTLNSMDNILNEMTYADFGDLCRMSPMDFEFLLYKIEPMIKKQTRLRIPITPKMRLAITLRYLATGDSYRRLHCYFKVSAPAISLIVPEVCKAINIVLKDQIKLPQTEEEWLAIEKGFNKKFPQCVGAVDGKQIVVKHPATASTEYTNSYRIILMVLVDSDYRFIFADICKLGCISDGGFFQHSSLWQKIVSGIINLPPDRPLPGRECNAPYVFLGDESFELHRQIMRPFSENDDIGTVERTFNNKHSSTHAIVENVFGVLTSVFKIFKKPIETDREKVPLITKTCILLHNYLRNSETSRGIYTPAGTFDSLADGQDADGSWRQNHNGSLALRPMPQVSSQAPNKISEIRSEFANYFQTFC